MEQPTTPAAPKTGRKLTQKEYQLVILAAGFLFAVGTILWGMGVFKSDPKPPGEAEGNQTEALAVPGAKNRKMENDKYKNAGKDDPRFTRNGGQSSPEMGFVVGAEPTDRQVSNETLGAEDYGAVGEAGRQARLTTANQRKRDTHAQQQARLRQSQRENGRLADPNAALFRRSPQEIEEERRVMEDREINQRTANLLLDRMEKGSAGQAGAVPVLPATANQGAGGVGAPVPGSVPAADATVMHGEVSKNTIGQPNDKIGFFYNVSTKNRRSYTANDAIMAVVHGHGAEGITVRDGGTAKIRLMQNAVFQLGGQDVILPKGTLLNGTCSIGADRVYIAVTSLVFGEAIHSIEVQVFDLDGQQGIHVPNLSEKNQIARRLAQTGTNAGAMGTNVIVGQGTVGQQVGTQVAVQGVRQAIQGARQLVTARASTPKVTIRANYKILLKSDKAIPTSSINESYEGY